MQLYKTSTKNILLHEEKAYTANGDWDNIINQENLYESLKQFISTGNEISKQDQEDLIKNKIQIPVGTQELWAAGVTYLRSRDARMEESKTGGGADFYQKVYEAERPELFFKSLPHRISAYGEPVYIRKDSSWNVPEPELTLYINSKGSIQGYTIGNDMSSRSIEGENPLYLPQAKMYERSAALGPCLYIPPQPISKDTNISLSITRKSENVFSGTIQLNRMKRELTELAGYLYREFIFPSGCFLMTGTGIVPPDHFTLEPGDVVEISIDKIGILKNTVAKQ
jgi:2-dehydro-3-deoxy-D-arabinonate dehydratase